MRGLVFPARLAAFAAVFAFLVIVFGAFVRLSNAGLSCPDWPTCYGRATWPGHEAAIAQANEAFPERPVETTKAWREQVHRMLAGTLGLLVFALALVAAWPRRVPLALLFAAAAAAAIGIASTMHGLHATSVAVSLLALLLPVGVAMRIDTGAPLRVAIAALSVVMFQAMLGMWTVTLLLKPVVVMGHLLGGLLTLSLLAYVALSLRPGPPPEPGLRRLRPMVVVALVLISLQVALGGWTSANYAALACGTDFPRCAGSWWPTTDFREGFVLWRGIGVNYEGGVLDIAARAAIQIAHRIGALVVAGHVLATAVIAWRRGLRGLGALFAILLCVQVALGIANVAWLLPLPVATAHNAVAALLLCTAIALLVRTGDRSIAGTT